MVQQQSNFEHEGTRMTDFDKIEVNLPKAIRAAVWLISGMLTAAIAVGAFVVSIEVRLSGLEKSLKDQSSQILAINVQNSKMAQQLERIEFKLHIPADVNPDFYITPTSPKSYTDSSDPDLTKAVRPHFPQTAQN
jgi:hypothetical protein